MDEPTETPLIRAQGLTRRFDRDGDTLTVLDRVSLSVNTGDMLAVVGASGAGKSTLLHLLGTLDRPSDGKVFFGGQDLSELDDRELADFRNRHLGFVFQFHHLLPEFTAVENVLMPAWISGDRTRAATERAESLLEEMGLSARRAHRPGELSGGEQQRVALARALMMEPPLVLADEPTGNLDSASSALVHDLFFRIHETRGTTFLVVTHNPALAQQMTRVVTMQDGRVLDDGLALGGGTALGGGLALETGDLGPEMGDRA